MLKFQDMLHRRNYQISVILFLVLLVCIVQVFIRSNKHPRSDELLSTGGAIRRSLKFRKTKVCKSKECNKIANYVKKSMNTLIDPCENFYEFACGGWIEKNPIPKTSSTFSTFAKLNSEVEKALRKIIEENTEKLTNKYREKAKIFYKSCMNLKSADKLGAQPLVNLIRDVGSSPLFDAQHWNEKTWSLRATTLKVQKKYSSAGGPLFSVYVSNDPRNNTRHILEVRREV